MDTRIRVIFGFLLFANTLLVLFLTSYTLQIRRDINDLKTALATKEDMLALTQVPKTDALQENCTQCHAENKFSSFHGSEADLLATIARMQAQTNSHIDPKDMDAIHASLSVLKCNDCHEDRTALRLALKSTAEQKVVIHDMLVRSGGSPSQEEVDRLQKSYQQLLGF